MSKPVTFLLTLSLLALSAAAREAPGAEELLACAQANWSSAAFHGVMQVRAFRPEFSREFRLEVWASERNEKALIRVLGPASEAGSAYLKLGDELWFYSPQAGQAIALPSASLGEAFFGSDVAVEDLYQGTLGDRYSAELLGTRTDEAGQVIHRLRLVPRPEADVVYGRLELEVADGSCAVLLIDYYDQRDTLIREAVFDEFVEVNGLTFATHVRVNDLLREGSYTEERIESFELGLTIPAARFTLDCLEDEAQCG